MTYRDRIEAAHELVDELQKYKGSHPLVLGIPRGAVPMAQIVAKELEGDLDVALVHKIGAPGNPEYAIGAVTEFGDILANDLRYEMELPPGYIKEAAQIEIKKLNRRRDIYSPYREAITPAGRTVIIVDDGIATGATMLAAIHSLRSQGAQKVIVAAPVASTEAYRKVKEVADEAIIVDVPEYFYAVGQFYRDFSQVTDSEVNDILRESLQRKTA